MELAVFQEYPERLAVTARILSTLFRAQIPASLEAALADGEFLDSWPLTDSFSAAGLAVLRGTGRNQDTGEELSWRDDALRLFGALGRPLAEPHESVWLSREHLLFEAETLQVRACYRRYGLGLVSEGREPDDHIAFELLFVAELLGLLAAAWRDVAAGDKASPAVGGTSDFPVAPHEPPTEKADGKTDRETAGGNRAATLEAWRGCRVRLEWVDDPEAVVDCATILADLGDFYREHLSRFAPQVCQRLEEHASARIFRALPDLTRGFLVSLEKFLAVD